MELVKSFIRFVNENPLFTTAPLEGHTCIIQALLRRLEVSHDKLEMLRKE